MTRIAYIFRLVVTLPEGSDADGWRPSEESGYDHTLYRADDAPFRWPRRRLYLSSEAAHRRASLLRRWGAEVEVQRSAPVEWVEQITMEGLVQKEIRRRYAVIADRVPVLELTARERAYVQKWLDAPDDAYMALVVQLELEGCEFPKVQAALMMLNTPGSVKELLR